MAHTEPDTATSTRWWALTWIALTQLMMVVVSTVMNIAVPSAQADLGLSDIERQWVITIYLLAFGSLLLLGGRISDTIGRRRALLIGLTGFTLASIIGGLAPNAETLLAARALQGAFSALIAPAALALLSLTFPAGPDRAKAFGIFGTIMGAGSGIGVVVGGILTDTWGWRSAMFINVPIAVAAAIGLTIAVTRDAPNPGRVDLLGGIISAAGFTALTLGFTSIQAAGPAAPRTLLLLGGGIVLIALFVWRQRAGSAPLMPLTLFSQRVRSSAFLAMFSWGIAIMPVFLFLSIFLQQVASLSPLLSGLAFLPYTAAILVTVRLIRPLGQKLPPRALIAAGLIIIALAFLMLTRLSADASYAAQVLPILILLGIGTASVHPASNSAATFQAGPASGAAGAVASTAQQVGSSLGMALFGSVSATATAAALAQGSAAPTAVVDGFAAAGTVGAGLLVVAALAVYVLAGRTPAPAEAR